MTQLPLNFATTLDVTDIDWFEAVAEPFSVYGLYKYENKSEFRRIPESLANILNFDAHSTHTNTSGGRIRFKTDSPFVAIKTVMRLENTRLPHMSFLAKTGFDLYEVSDSGETYINSYVPALDIKGGYESLVYTKKDKGLHGFQLNLPLYNNVIELYVGIKKGALLEKGVDYRHEKPVVFYGSSITQGGCASRPGNIYPAFVSRRLNSNYINLGFSGGAKGEEELAKHIASLDMSVFVCDYDHNAPDVQHLENTYFTFYEVIREKHPLLPYIMISRPDYEYDIPDSIRRRHVIYGAYMKAMKSGDKNVYYIDGKHLFGGYERDACTVDSCHPNDVGFYRMAEVIAEAIKPLLGVLK